MTPSPALFVACHPGHELRAIGWISRACPLVAILTDGSGHHHAPRLDSTRAVIAKTGGSISSIFGRWTDRELYALVLSRRHHAFIALAAELASMIEGNRIGLVVSDAAEGYNPGHDICRWIVDAAVESVGRSIRSYDLPLTSRPDPATVAVRIELSPDELARKLAIARGYSELADEVEHQIHQFGAESFASEVLLHRVDQSQSEPPQFERFGAERVSDGRYSEPISQAKHLDPIRQALREWSRSSVRRAA